MKPMTLKRSLTRMSEALDTPFFSQEGSRKGLLIVVSGPSGSGKGTVLTELFSKRSGLFYSVSATTRAPRPGEVDGQQYYFLTREKFEKMIQNGEMLEHAEYCGNYYGTPKKAVEEKCLGGADVILEIEVQGATQVKKACPSCAEIFIAPPSAAELEKRLRGRGTESDEVIKDRLETAIGEMVHAKNYDYIVVNDDVATAAKKIDSIITAEKCKYSRLGD
jgi:guanylate kinase